MHNARTLKFVGTSSAFVRAESVCMCFVTPHTPTYAVAAFKNNQMIQLFVNHRYAASMMFSRFKF